MAVAKLLDLVRQWPVYKNDQGRLSRIFPSIHTRSCDQGETALKTGGQLAESFAVVERITRGHTKCIIVKKRCTIFSLYIGKGSHHKVLGPCSSRMDTTESPFSM